MIRYLLPMVLVLGCQPNLRGYQRCASDADCPQSYCLEAICAPAGSERISRDGGTDVDGGSAANPDAGDGGSAANPDAGDGGSAANLDAGGGVAACTDDGDCEEGQFCEMGLCIEFDGESCDQLYQLGERGLNNRRLRFGQVMVETLCDHGSDNGGWTLMQRAMRGEMLWDANNEGDVFGSPRELPNGINGELSGGGGAWTFHIPFSLIDDETYNNLTFRIMVYTYEQVGRTVTRYFYQDLDRTVWTLGQMGPFDSDYYRFASRDDAEYEECHGAVHRTGTSNAWGVYDLANMDSCATYMGSGWLIQVDEQSVANLLSAPSGFEDSTEWHALEVWTRPRTRGGVAPAP